jgi:4-hydroxy 2-oxovalerate aldolase
MRILDCTLRDGGYTNNWNFSKEQVVDNYTACKNAGVEYSELGFRRSCPEEGFGVWYHTPETLINETLGDFVCEDTKIAIMAQMGTFTIDDFVPKKDSHITMVRVLIAYHCIDKDDSILNVDLINETCDMVLKLKKLGYEVTVNIGRIDKMTYAQIEETCKLISIASPDYFYIADTYGHLGIMNMKGILDVIKSVYSGKIGFHAHDNLLNATVKSIDSYYNGVSIVDGTMSGIGRGSGNAKTELLIAHTILKNKDGYNLLPVLEYCEKWIGSYKNNHVLYFITGMYSMHVNYAITLIEKYDFTFSKCFKILMHVLKENKHHFFDGKYLQSVCDLY